MEGAVWNHPYVGFHPREAPDGTYWEGAPDIEAVITRLQEAERHLKDPDTPLLAWGFDPIYFTGRRMSTADLDRVSRTRPVLIMHASFHIMNVNQVVMDRIQIRPGTNIEGVVTDEQGTPTGELKGPTCRYMVLKIVGEELWGSTLQAEIIWQFARSAQRAGVTTATDLHNELTDATVAALTGATASDEFPNTDCACDGCGSPPACGRS